MPVRLMQAQLVPDASVDQNQPALEDPRSQAGIAHVRIMYRYDLAKHAGIAADHDQVVRRRAPDDDIAEHPQNTGR
jgi:hypothetical protein